MNLKRSYQVEQAASDTPERDNAQPLVYTRYSAHRDLEKAKKSLLRAHKQPGAGQYTWRIRCLETGALWTYAGQGKWLLDLSPVMSAT